MTLYISIVSIKMANDTKTNKPTIILKLIRPIFIWKKGIVCTHLSQRAKCKISELKGNGERLCEMERRGRLVHAGY